MTLLENRIIFDLSSIDLIYKLETGPCSNTRTIHYKIGLVRRGVEKEFHINYDEDKTLRDSDFEKILKKEKFYE